MRDGFKNDVLTDAACERVCKSSLTRPLSGKKTIEIACFDNEF